VTYTWRRETASRYAIVRMASTDGENTLSI
jgi:hypothetical protein